MKIYKHIIITGPSFVGKTFIAGLILAQEHAFKKCVTATTRIPRTGEQNGKDYFFFSLKKFLELKDQDFFLETNPFLKKKDGSEPTRYGTPRSFVDEHKDKTPILFVVDPKGAHSIQKYLGTDSITVFIAPESEQVLIDRIHKRRTNETDEEIADRLELAKSQMAEKDSFDYCLINYEGIEKAKALAAQIIRSAYAA